MSEFSLDFYRFLNRFLATKSFKNQQKNKQKINGRAKQQNMKNPPKTWEGCQKIRFAALKIQ